MKVEVDLSLFAKHLRKQFQLQGIDSPSHVQLLNLLAKSTGFQNYQSLKAYSESSDKQSSPGANQDLSDFSGASVGRFYVSMCKTKARVLRNNLVGHPALSVIADNAGVARSAALGFYRRDDLSMSDFYYVLALAGNLGIDPGWFLLDQGDLPAHITLPREASEEIVSARAKLARELKRSDLMSDGDAGSIPGASLGNAIRLLQDELDETTDEQTVAKLNDAMKGLSRAKERLG
jgi:hypothetical protein